MKKLFNKKLTKTWIVALIMLIVAIVGILIMPDIIPTHFGPSGEPDGWGTKYTVLMFPAITILVAVLAVPMMRLDPKEENYGRFEKYYYNFFFGFSLFFLAVEVLNIVIAMGININMGMIMCLVTGLLMIFVGNMMPKIKQNFYFGIKTPWTLADEENWKATHKLAGPLWNALSAQLKEAGLWERLSLPALQAIDELSYRMALQSDEIVTWLE